MNEIINRWIERIPPVSGVLACGVRHPDNTSASRSWSDELAAEALDNAWRGAADVFHVLKLNRLPFERMRWVYEQALLYCEQNEDGACFVLFTARDPQRVDHEGIARLLREFHTLG